MYITSFPPKAFLVCVVFVAWLCPAYAQVMISADTTFGCAPLSVNFQADAPGANGFIWDFGDGTTSTLQNPGRIYSQGGSYIVTVTATYPNQPPVTATLSDTIKVFGDPTAWFNATPLIVCKGDPVQFTDSSTTGGAPINSWLWSFGDGFVSSQQNPAHAYSQPGFYSVSLSVEDGNLCGDLAFRVGYINVKGPDASFSYNNSFACNPPLRVNFTSQGTNIVTHFWDFGDGNTATTVNPSHRYTNNGSFTVTHIVTDAFGCSDTTVFPNVINIGQNSATITAIPQTACPDQPIQFQCGSSTALSILWNFGPGRPNYTVCNVRDSFPAPGNYTVTLQLTEPNNCIVNASTVITITTPLAPSFTASNLSSCRAPHTVNFTNTTPNPPGTQWLWRFGDGRISTARNPSHTYSWPGVYSVKLIVTDPNGCIDSLEKINYIDVGFLSPHFSPVPASGCKPLPVMFNDHSLSNSPIVSWQWDFGDGNTSTLSNPSNVYLDTGYYDVQLIISNANGCTDSVTYRRRVQVGDTVHANFTYLDTVVCGKDTISFRNLSTGNINKTRWFFSDGTVKVDSFHIKYSYVDTGYHGVMLVVSDRGCADTLQRDSIVYIKPVIANFLGNFIGCDTPHTVNFINASLGGHVWHWDFGTGNPGDTSNVQQPSFTYDSTGSYLVVLTALDTVTGCDYEDKASVEVELVNANFVVDTASGCRPFLVNFTDSSLNAVTWVWHSGDGNGSTMQNFSNIYQYAGTFSPRLQVWNRLGCKDDTLSRALIWSMDPLVSFGVPDTNGCAPFLVPFQNQTASLAPVVRWRWDFGTGDTSALDTPSYTYTQPGNYTVTLFAEDSAGCTRTLTRQQYIFVTDPIADFTIDHPLNCPNNPIQFTNNSSGQTPLIYQWDFGNGAFSNQLHPVYSYPNTGTYTVTLTVTDTLGCIETQSQVVTIAIPDISLLADTTNASCPPLLVQFTGQVNSPHNFTNWQWDLGNGASFVQNPINLYVNPGNYTVSVIATTAAGCADTVTIRDLIQIGGPSGTFSQAPLSGCPGQAVTFTASTSQAMFTQWDFGDGFVTPGNSLDTLITHVYQDSGVFYPTMILNDGLGCLISVRAQDSVVIYPNPNVSFAPGSIQLCDSGQVAFTDLSTSSTPLTGWTWDFGDGTRSLVQNPVHSFSVPDTYQITLVVSTLYGCVDTLSLPAVAVHPSPRAEMELSDTAGCIPFVVRVRDLTNGTYASIQAWNWDFGFSGGVSLQPVDSFSYPVAGVYPIRLEVTDANGCTAQIDSSVTAWPLPAPDFTASDSFGCAPAFIQFTDLSSPVVSWLWDFGDGNSSIGQHPGHQYQADSLYTVSLTVTDFRGCENQLVKPQYIRLAHPVADFEAAPREGCPGMEVLFRDLTQTDTAITSWSWDFGDGLTGSGPSPTHTYTQTGVYSVRLIVTDVFGCSDTMVRSDYIRIWENFTPQSPEIEYVTVQSDREIYVKWTLFANPNSDFYRYILYRSDGTGPFQPVYSSTNLNTISYADNQVNTLASAYCYLLQVVNQCETGSVLDESLAHCSILLNAIPDLDAIRVDWTEYKGWPQVDRYKVFRVRDYTPNGAVLIGTVAGDITTFLDTQVFCYDPVTYRVHAEFASRLSQSNISQAAPIHFPSDQPTHMVRATVVQNEDVKVEWNIPQVTDGVTLVIERDAGSGYGEAYRQPYQSTTLSWIDNQVDVQSRSYRYRASVIDTCGDKTPLGRDATSIRLVAERSRGKVSLAWTPYETWANGVRFYRIEVFDEGSGTFTLVDQLHGRAHAFVDEKTTLNQGTYCYRITALELGGTDTLSLSNEACVTVDPDLFSPNAFTPNGDGLNDEFIIYDLYLATYHLQIFSRWGNLIFETRDPSHGWDGRYKGKDVPEGAYVYIVRGVGYEGQEIDKRGTVTVIR